MTDFWVTETPTGCWEWAGYRDSDGYGQLGRNTKAHRRMYELAIGPIPAGLLILHACDNPPCVQPEHLFAGTKRDNGIDMAAKGRAALARLSIDQVRVIRARVAAGEVQRRIAREYGVRPNTICDIVNRRTFKALA